MQSPPSPQWPIELIYDNAAVEHQLSADRNDMLAPDISRVLVIYTGGTIGMKQTPDHGYIPLPNYLAQSLAKVQRFHDSCNSQGTIPRSRASSTDSYTGLAQNEASPRASSPVNADYQFGRFSNTVRSITHAGPNKGEETISQLPSLITPVSLYGKRIRYSILEYVPLLDSSNMNMSDWTRIAGDIEANYRYYDAFIVLHGTDTMAYTASALSFMLEELGKTVIVTGSQVPLTEVRNDAVENLLGALTIAGHFVIPEVSLYFSQKLYRGNRTSKVSAVDFDAFDSPNMPSLVDVGINIDVKWPFVLRPMHIAKFRVQKELNTNVALLRLFPGISEITVRNFLAAPIQGVVLETYGAGNAPARADIIQALKEACDRGVVIVNCTQCRKGLVTDAYATGKQLARIGVVAGADMTPECALTKLSYLLGSMADQPDQVRRLMGKNLRGELTVIAPFQRFSATNTRTNALIETIMMLSAHAQRVAMEGFEGDRVPDLTMSLEDQQLAEKVLGPVLLCSAAGASDVKGVADLFGGMGEMINLNCADYDGRVPLHVACREGHVRTVEFLLQHGASIHLRDRTGHTPLFDAVAYKRVEVVQLLVSTGAYWTENEIEDFGPIWLRAAKDGDIKKMKIALDAGWRVNWAEPVENRRALDVAVCQGRISVLKVLVGQPDLDLDLQDRWGFSIWDKLGMLKQATEVSERQGTHHKLEATIITQMEAILASKGANSTAQGQPN